jgi:benzoyl-CoA reductase subunit BamC
MSEPMCVQVCRPGALTYEVREEEREEEEPKLGEMEVGLQSLLNKHGLEKVMDTVARLGKRQ